MYSLLVIHAVSERTEGAFAIDKSRFLEYTADEIAIQLRSLSIEARECIRSWPCILMQEGRGQEEAHVVEITRVDADPSEVKVTISPLPGRLVLSNDALWKMREVLDIGDFEFSRNHWAIKDRDLFATLAAAGYHVEVTAASRFEPRPLPAPRRQDLLRARDAISGWGHTEIDDLLLEAGIRKLAAGREVGGRRDRANAIVKFALEHPSETTAENSLFAVFLARRALSGSDEIASPERSGHGATGATDTVADLAGVTAATNRSPNRVFVVHGQNESAREEVVSFLDAVGLKGIVLHDQPSMGRHLLTKFIEEAELVTFAIVLMTDDDVGARKGSTPAPRARQNVILELGYFLAHLGQPRVCALITPGLETPSDFDGIVYIRMDNGGRWKAELRRELVAAGMPLSDEAT